MTVPTFEKKKYEGKSSVIDPESGEFREVLLFGAAGEFRDKDFTKVFHAFTEKLVEDEDIAGKAIRLLFWIIRNLKHNDIHFYMTYSVVKKDINVSKATYARWSRILKEKGIIRKVDSSLFMINPACVAVGKAHALMDIWEAAIEEEN